MTNTNTTRKALGLGRNRKRKPGTALLAGGIALVALGAYLAGSTSSGNSGGGDGSRGATESVGASATTTAPETIAPVATVLAPPVIAIPPGYEAIAVTLPFTAGGGGYVGAGDRVNVFGLDQAIGDVATLLLADVAVLDVSAEVEPRIVTGTQERGSTSHLTYLLAVPRSDVARVIAAVQSQTIYLSLLSDAIPGAPEVGAARSSDVNSLEPAGEQP